MIIKLIIGILITLVMSSGAVFGENLELAVIKKAIKDKGANWTAGENAISKLSPEARKRLCGAIIVPHTEQGVTLKSTKAIPSSLDWRNVNGTNWTTPIRDQGACGSCVAFGAIGALEPLAKIEANNPTLPIDLSEQHLFSCGGGDCDYGWIPFLAANYLKNNGTPDEQCYPYISGNGNDYPCSGTCPDWQDRAVKISQWKWVANNPSNIETALLTAPLSTTMDVYTDFFYYTGGIYEHTWGNLEGGHQITFVGYNATENYWICKNSWGTGWGEQGWFRIRFGNSGIGGDTILMSGVIQPQNLSLDIILNGGTFTVGDAFIVKTHVTNDSTSDIVDEKIWIKFPDDTLRSILNLPKTTIDANTNLETTILNYIVTGTDLLGNYECGGRFLNWINGDILCEDIEPFVNH